MLKKKYRLPSSVRLEKAKTISAKSFILKISSNQLSYPRFAFVISKKVDTRAVVRNRIKREMTNYLHEKVDRISGKDMIFILKKGSFEEVTSLGKSIEEAFIKEGLLK